MTEERLYVDIERCMAGACDAGGLTPKMLERVTPRLEKARRAVLDAAGTGMLGWMDLPRQDPAEFLAFAEQSAGRFECVLVIGIGGSALGTIALSTALLPFYHNELAADELSKRAAKTAQKEIFKTKFVLDFVIFPPCFCVLKMYLFFFIFIPQYNIIRHNFNHFIIVYFSSNVNAKCFF